MSAILIPKRGDSMREEHKQGKRGRPKRFGSAKLLIDLFASFCEEIIESGFSVTPTQTEFCRWLQHNYEQTDRRTIYNALNNYFPTVKRDFEQMQSDVIAEGAMLGKYQPTMSIFALKNWCKWTDRQETDSKADYEDLTPLVELLS